MEGLSCPEAAGTNVCTRGFCCVVSPINGGGGGCRGSVWSIEVCPPPCRPGEGKLSTGWGSISAAHRDSRFYMFFFLSTGSLCSSCYKHSIVPSTGCVSRQAICSFSQYEEKFELFCYTCVQREHEAGVTGIWHTCSISKREFGGLNTCVGLVYADEREDRFLVRCCEGHNETAISGKEWVGFFDQLQWLVKKFK